jgi:hypothetical protein
MASFLNFYLDLVKPSGVTLSAPANSGTLDVTVTGGCTDADKTNYTMKFWGVGVVTNTVAGDTELNAPPLPYDALPHVITFATEGAKTLYFAVYDPVANKSIEATAGIAIETSLPTITIDNVTGGYNPNLGANDAGRFSLQDTKRTLQFRFNSNVDILEWKIRRVTSSTALHDDAGNQIIGTTNGSTVGAVENISAGVFENITIDMRDMPNQVTEAKIIKVFARNVAGWSQ